MQVSGSPENKGGDVGNLGQDDGEWTVVDRQRKSSDQQNNSVVESATTVETFAVITVHKNRFAVLGEGNSDGYDSSNDVSDSNSSPTPTSDSDDDDEMPGLVISYNSNSQSPPLTAKERQKLLDKRDEDKRPQHTRAQSNLSFLSTKKINALNKQVNHIRAQSQVPAEQDGDLSNYIAASEIVTECILNIYKHHLLRAILVDSSPLTKDDLENQVNPVPEDVLERYRGFDKVLLAFPTKQPSYDTTNSFMNQDNEYNFAIIKVKNGILDMKLESMNLELAAGDVSGIDAILRGIEKTITGKTLDELIDIELNALSKFKINIAKIYSHKVKPDGEDKGKTSFQVIEEFIQEDIKKFSGKEKYPMDSIYSVSNNQPGYGMGKSMVHSDSSGGNLSGRTTPPQDDKEEKTPTPGHSRENSGSSGSSGSSADSFHTADGNVRGRGSGESLVSGFTDDGDENKQELNPDNITGGVIARANIYEAHVLSQNPNLVRPDDPETRAAMQASGSLAEVVNSESLANVLKNDESTQSLKSAGSESSDDSVATKVRSPAAPESPAAKAAVAAKPWAKDDLEVGLRNDKTKVVQVRAKDDLDYYMANKAQEKLDKEQKQPRAPLRT